MSLSPAAQSSNNSNDRRLTEKSIRAGSVWAFLYRELGTKICARLRRAVLRTEECDAQEREQKKKKLDDMRGAGAFTAPRGVGRMAHLFKQPELSRGNENFHLSRAAHQIPFTSSLARSLSSVSTAGSGSVFSLSLSAHQHPAPDQIKITQLVQVEN